MSKYEYYQLCAKAVSGQITSDEDGRLKDWLNSSPKNRAYYNDILKVWDSTESPPSPYIANVDEGWSKIHQSLGLEIKSESKKEHYKTVPNFFNRLTHIFKPQYRPVIYSFATILILAVGFLLLRNQLSTKPFQEIVTFNRQKIQITLSDGSQIHLNSGSRLKFQKNFTGSVREVILEGEAFFEVAHEQRPFIVTTANARTTVLGTQFNIHSRNNATRVIVQEGRVDLCPTTLSENHVVLSEGQMSHVTGMALPPPPENVNVDHLLGWLEDKLVFEITPLKEILEELERYYDITIEAVDSELEEKTITATFERLPIETVLSSICLTLDAKYENDNSIYRIMNKP